MFQEILTKIDIISPIFYQILYMTVVGSIVGLLIYFVRNIFDNKISGKWKCIMWSIVLVALLIPIRFEIKTEKKMPQIQNEIIERVEDIKYIGSYEVTEEENSDLPNLEENEPIIQNNESINSSVNNINIEHAKNKISVKTIVINIVIPYIWLLGTIIFILTFLSGIGKINKRISRNVYRDERLELILNDCKNQLNIKKKVKIILQKYKKVPSIFGIFNPAILITEKTLQEDNETIKYIFLHELAHYKRKDIVFNFILLCVLSIHWFNPVVWFLFNKIRQDIEIGADELASKKLNKNEKKEYGMVLINLLRNKQEENYTANMLCMSDTGKNMERRIYMIKGKRKSVILSFMLVTIIVGVVAGIVFVKFTDKNPINEGATSNTLSQNNVQDMAELTEEEKIAVENYVRKICNTQAILPEFKNIEDVSRMWLFTHLTPRHTVSGFYNEPYSTKEEIEEDLKKLFGINIVIDDEKDFEDLQRANNIVKTSNRYSFLAYDLYSEPKYFVKDIEKINEQYIAKVIEYFEVCDLEEKYPGGSHMLIYNYEQYQKSDSITELGQELFNVDFSKYDDSESADNVVAEEVLKRPNDGFRSFDVIVVPNNENGFFIKEVVQTTSSTKENSNTNISNISTETQVGNLDLEITGGSGFSEGLASVCVNGEYVYIDKLGNIVLNCGATDNFFNGLVVDAKEVGRMQYKYGYLDKQGNVAIDYIYDQAYSFQDGLAPVQKDGKWAYIDTKGNIVKDYLYEDTPGFFHEGIHWIYNEKLRKSCC